MDEITIPDIELIKYCRYYKGEEQNPYNDVDQDKAMLWMYEKCFVMHGPRYDYSIYLSEYAVVGLTSFAKDDGVPIEYKALLFNRYVKTEYSLMDAAEPFKMFYLKYYGEE